MIDTDAIDLSALIAAVDNELIASGLAKRQRALLDGIPTGAIRWVFLDKARLKTLMGSAVIEADGSEELAAINAIAAASLNPFLAFRNAMSPESLQILALSLARDRDSATPQDCHRKTTVDKARTCGHNLYTD